MMGIGCVAPEDVPSWCRLFEVMTRAPQGMGITTFPAFIEGRSWVGVILSAFVHTKRSHRRVSEIFTDLIWLPSRA